jgi:hypothetical protein
MSQEAYGPEVEAASFIKQYYEKLAQAPEELHRFYTSDAYFTHCEGPDQVILDL